MRVGVWGAGEIGLAAAYRLTTSPYVSEVHWINRSYDKIRSRVVDLQHGLAFTPTCHLVKAYHQKRARYAVGQTDLLVLTLGASVPAGAERDQVLAANVECFDEVATTVLRGYEGIVLVVTNPVDLMALHVHRRAGVDARRCIGLGTVVETARLRASLGKHMVPLRAAREVFAYAVGTHDANVAVVTGGAAAPGVGELRAETVEIARSETVNGAARVKEDQRSTLHPVVEGVVAVVEAIASDRAAVLTVSTYDAKEELFFSVPCTLGRSGLVHRHVEVLEAASVRAGVDVGLVALRAQLATLAGQKPRTG